MNEDQVNQNLDKVISDAASQMSTSTQLPVSKSHINLGAFSDTLLNYIVPIVALVLSTLIGVFVLYPSYASVPELNAQLEMSDGLKNDLAMKVETLNRLSDFKNVVEENSDLVNKVLASEQLVPGLLTQIDKISRESGFSLSRLNYGLGTTTALTGTAEDSITYDFITVNLGVSGSFEQLKVFLKNLENSARIINVDKFRYSLTDTEEGPSLGVTFVLVSPYLHVKSDAVTDEPINLDISNPNFVKLINKIKNLRYYDPADVDISVPVIEVSEDEEEEVEEDADITAVDDAELQAIIAKDESLQGL